MRSVFWIYEVSFRTRKVRFERVVFVGREVECVWEFLFRELFFGVVVLLCS